MEYLKKEIRTFQNGKTVNDQFYIDDDYNVPDAKKDVGRIMPGSLLFGWPMYGLPNLKNFSMTSSKIGRAHV